jgi:signal transduction histidine kinase
LEQVSIPNHLVGDEAEAADQLDLATALAISQAISSEMDHGRLVEGLLSIAVRTAGAEHAVLLVPRDGNMVVEAYAIVRDGRVDVRPKPEGDRSAVFSEGLVRQVITTGAPVALDDAASVGPFVNEPYVVAHRCRSLACVPLMRRRQLEGVLYFENNLAARVFAARRFVAMTFIASQAANALENARLYAGMQKARAAEQALHETREALGHLARVATLGELTASIAHEVNQPLTAIRVNAATCVRWLQASQTAEAVAAAVRVGRDAEHAMEVIDRLRSLFKKQGTERVELDLNEAVAEVVALTRSEMTKHSILAEVQLAPEGPRVLANRVQIQQVVMNFVLNAIQAMQDVQDRPRLLVVRIGLTGEGRVQASVRDSGIGVPEEHIAALFQPFFSTKREGTGVGLSISQSIVASHQGEVWHSPNDGPGATFGFDLPSLPPRR